MEKDYIIVGDNNYWYATLTDKKHIESELKEIKSNILDGVYGAGGESAETLYVYEAVEIKRINID